MVAAGVAKAKADHITVSGHDGGTGAAVRGPRLLLLLLLRTSVGSLLSLVTFRRFRPKRYIKVTFVIPVDCTL